MPDYHIYIHSNEQRASEKTKPMTMESQGAFIPDFLQDLEQQKQQIAQEESSVMGVAPLFAFGAVGALAISSLKVASHVIVNSINAYSKYTGSYQYSMELSNLRTAVSALSVSTQIQNLRNAYLRQIEIRNHNIQVNLEREVIGGYVADKYKKGV